MPDPMYVLAALTTMLVITFVLRAAPFAMIDRLRDRPIVGFLGHHMPVGILVILFVYTVKDVDVVGGHHGLPEAIAVVVTATLHIWRRNAVLSVVGGTLLYIGLKSFVFE